MILGERAIKYEIKKGNISIHPINEDEQIGPNSIDLRLGNKLYVVEDKPVRNLAHAEHYSDKAEERKGSDMYIDKDEFVIAPTYEVISLNSGICGKVTGKSSNARHGLSVHRTANMINAGFEGHLALEMSSKEGVGMIELEPFIQVCQIALERLEGSGKRYDGIYSQQGDEDIN